MNLGINLNVDKTTLFGSMTAVGLALAGSGLTEVMPEFITELVPMWARQLGAVMAIAGPILASKFAADKTELRQVAFKPEQRPEPVKVDEPKKEAENK